MKTMLVALVMVAVVPAIALGADVARNQMLAQAKTDTGALPKVREAKLVTVRGTVEAIDKEKQTVTLKGPKKTLTVKVRDPQKLDAIKVGDPVIGKYYESLMIEVKKPGEGTPGVTAEKATATSKPGEVPAGAIGQQVTVTATIVAVDKKAGTVTIKGPEGNTVTVKARDPKNLEKVKAGDNVEITYTEALAISLDKPAKTATSGKKS
jgi:Cu/Ag efflux protein CusF